MAELSVRARELRPGDRIVAVQHGNNPRLSKSNWVVAASYGKIQPNGAWGIAMRKPNPDSWYELNLWETTDWDASTIFFVERSASTPPIHSTELRRFTS